MPKTRTKVYTTKTFREMAKEKGYDKDWVTRTEEQANRAEYLAQVQRTFAAGGKHRTLEGHEKAKKGPPGAR